VISIIPIIKVRKPNEFERIFNRLEVVLNINLSLRAECSFVTHSEAMTQSLCSLDTGNIDIV